MRLTWKDGVATLLMAAVGVVTVATMQGWGWPLLGGYRSAGVIVFGLGMVMCPVGGSALRTPEDMREPYVRFASALGIVSLVALAGLLIWGTQAWFVALVMDVALLWAMSTIRHAVRGTAAPQASPAR
jgi:hypothetical protein